MWVYDGREGFDGRGGGRVVAYLGRLEVKVEVEVEVGNDLATSTTKR